MDEQHAKYKKSLENMSHFLGNGDLRMTCAAAGDADFYLRAYLVHFNRDGLTLIGTSKELVSKT